MNLKNDNELSQNTFILTLQKHAKHHHIVFKNTDGCNPQEKPSALWFPLQ